MDNFSYKNSGKQEVQINRNHFMAKNAARYSLWPNFCVVVASAGTPETGRKIERRGKIKKKQKKKRVGQKERASGE